MFQKILYMYMLLPFVLLLLSPLFISDIISKPILVSESTVSVISDITMQSANVTSVPICTSVCRNQCRAFFYQPSTLLHNGVNICKLRVHCHDVCNIAPSTCMPANFVKIKSNAIRSNVHKTVVSYQKVQSFCSDVVAQNVNVISSPACKVVYFKKYHYVLPIKSFLLETYPFTVALSARLLSSSSLSPSSLLSPLLLSSISTSPSSSPLSSSLTFSINSPSSSSSSP